MDTPAELVQTIFAAIGIIWLPIQIVLNWRLAQKTSELEHEVNRLNVELDQKIKRLYRMRDLVNFVLENNIRAVDSRFDPSENAQVIASAIVFNRELQGLARASKEPELLTLVSEFQNFALSVREGLMNQDNEIWREAMLELLPRAAKIHEEIALLLDKETQTHNRKRK